MATFGKMRSSPSTHCASAGMKPSRAAFSARPEPSALASTTLPARIASTSPGTPNLDDPMSSTGSAKSEVDAPQQHFHPQQTGNGAQVDLLIPHRQILALDETQAEVAGEVGMFEIGLV